MIVVAVAVAVDGVRFAAVACDPLVPLGLVIFALVCWGLVLFGVAADAAVRVVLAVL